MNKILLGIDEVGRGPWAGPLVIGAVILNNPDTSPQNAQSSSWIDQLTDSKRLTAKKRAELAPIILEKATATGLGWVSAAELDRYGLSNSLKLAARRAVKQVLRSKIRFDEIIIDGTINFLTETPLEGKVTLLKKADLLIKEVSAASIIAKVARDSYMVELAQKYPAYGFESHVGYGTATHQQALLEHGICPEHRKSFRPIRELLTLEPRQTVTSKTTVASKHRKPLATTSLGQIGEEIVIEHLRSLDHTIIAHNFKTKSYEIDIISAYEDKIYFTEVKYRKTKSRGTALEQITPKKRAQIQYAAESYLKSHPKFAKLQPLLAAGAVEGKTPKLKGWFALTD